MKEVSENKVQISACINKSNANEVVELSGTEKRNFSQMIDVLIGEALEARKAVQNHFKGILDKSKK